MIIDHLETDWFWKFTPLSIHMRHWTWLMRLAAAVWLAWLGLIGLMFGMLRLGAWHPHFLPVTAVLAVLLAAGLSLLIFGSWRLLRGPWRLHALVCLLLGLPPLGFLAGHLMYGFGTAYGRQFTLGLPLKLLVPFGESILDLVARFQYPGRTEGERVVMISTPVESARAQVAAIDQLDEAYWADLEKQCGSGGYHGYWLASLQLGPGVDPADWKRFISDYLAAAGRLLAPYQHVQLIAERVHSSEDAKAQTSSFLWRYELKRSGPFRTFRERFQDHEEVFLAHPEHSFRAERKSPAEAWEIHEDPSVKPEQAYRRIVREIDLMQPVYHDTVPLFSLADFATTLVNPLSLRVTRLERFTENGRRFIRIEFQDCPPGHPIYRELNLRISADDYFVVHDESVGKSGQTWRGDAVYESHDGVPLLQSLRGEGQWDDGSHATNVLTVVDRRFEPIPEDEFTPERLLGEAPVKRVGPKHDTEEVSGLLSWYPLPLVVSALSLAAGACLVPRTRGQGNASG